MQTLNGAALLEKLISFETPKINDSYIFDKILRNANKLKIADDGR